MPARFRFMSELNTMRAGTSPAPTSDGARRSFSLFRLTALWEAFLVALGSLRQNKMRTALTLVGIVVGVAAVIAVVTIIQGLDNKVATTFSSQGSTVFTISKRPQIIRSREEFVKFNKRKDVTHEDAEAIARLCTACWRVGVAANVRETVKHGDQKFENVNIRGVTPTTMFDIDGRSIDVGRIWTEAEGISGREICVVGPDVLTNLFGGASADRVIRPGSQNRRPPFSNPGRARAARFDLWRVARQRRLHSLFDLPENLWRARFDRRFHPGPGRRAT